MSLKGKINLDFKRILKEKKDFELSVLRQLRAAILNREKEKRAKIAKEKDYYPRTGPPASRAGLAGRPTVLPVPPSRPKEEIEEELAKESQLTDEEIIEVVSSEIKKRKEAILEFSVYAKGYGGPAEAPTFRSEGGEKGKIERFIEKEKREMKILEKYLPEQLSEEEVKKLAKEAIDKIGTTSQKDMGKVMAELMPKVKGRADGAIVNRIVKELLS